MHIYACMTHTCMCVRECVCCVCLRVHACMCVWLQVCVCVCACVCVCLGISQVPSSWVPCHLPQSLSHSYMCGNTPSVWQQKKSCVPCTWCFSHPATENKIIPQHPSEHKEQEKGQCTLHPPLLHIHICRTGTCVVCVEYNIMTIHLLFLMF